MPKEHSKTGDPAVGSTRLLGREYTTRASAHGMAYMPLSPNTFNMTLEEAEADVRFWRAYADTVGGDAIIVKRPNKQA
jgi:hypothetical protein